MKKRITVKELAEKIQVLNPKVLFMGEYHTDDAADSYPWILNHLKRAMPKLNCLAFEADPKQNPDGVRRAPWKKLAGLAKVKYAIESYLVDGLCAEQNGSAEERGNTFMAINTRNRCMAKNLEHLLASGQCDQIWMTNGALHLQDNYIDGRPSVPHRLEAKGISTFTIAAMDLSKGNGKSQQGALDAWIWPKGPGAGKTWSDPKAHLPLCKDVPGAIHENYAFLNTGIALAKTVPITHVHGTDAGTSGSWDQFDAVLMLGCPKSASDFCPY